MRIGVDLDGVCYDFTASLRHYLVENRGYDPDLLPPSTCWNFYKDDWGMELDEYLQHFADGVDSGVVFLHGEPEEGCVKYMTKLREDGHTIHIVTHRAMGKKSVQNTGEWLFREGIPFDELTFAKDKTTTRTDAFIEDNMDNFKALEAVEVEAFLMDRPWNRELKTHFRVYGWEDFYRKIKEIESIYE